jgi:hypothetical protein
MAFPVFAKWEKGVFNPHGCLCRCHADCFSVLGRRTGVPDLEVAGRSGHGAGVYADGGAFGIFRRKVERGRQQAPVFLHRRGNVACSRQRQMWEDAKERLLSGQIQRPIQLLAKKFVHFWRGDAMAVEYAAKVLPNPSFFKVVSNGFFYAMSLWAAWGAMLAMKRKETSILAPVSLFAVGLTMAHLLVEVATRYHYSAVVSIVFLAAYGLSVRPDFSEGRNKHEQK